MTVPGRSDAPWKAALEQVARVQSVDLPRNRIALSMRSDGGMGPKGGSAEGGTRRDVEQNNRETRQNTGQRAPLKGGFKPAAKPFVPTKGAVAPNGIRFK